MEDVTTDAGPRPDQGHARDDAGAWLFPPAGAPLQTPPILGDLPPRRRRRLAIALALVVIAAGLAAGVISRNEGSSPAATIGDLRAGREAPPASETADVVREVLPSVVNVRTTAVGVDFFGRATESRGEGSGVVIDEAGIVVTNNHVVQGAVEVTVVFNDGEHGQMTGTVIGTDPEHDLAVIRVDADDLTPIQLGGSGALELGDTVIALGYPLGLGGPTVTQGIVSGLDRSVRASNQGAVEQLAGLIQTDAAINPGNSGGALVDGAGRLIGINTAAAAAASAENVGFAIPIDDALPLIEQLLENPGAATTWLGVQTQSVRTSSDAAQLGLPLETRGALIVSVVPGGPAARAGLEPGDVVVGIDGVRVRSASDLTEQVTRRDPGDEASVRLADAEGERTVRVRLGTRPF